MAILVALLPYNQKVLASTRRWGGLGPFFVEFSCFLFAYVGILQMPRFRFTVQTICNVTIVFNKCNKGVKKFHWISFNNKISKMYVLTGFVLMHLDLLRCLFQRWGDEHSKCWFYTFSELTLYKYLKHYVVANNNNA